jgi:hypothetical protein
MVASFRCSSDPEKNSCPQIAQIATDFKKHHCPLFSQHAGVPDGRSGNVIHLR